MIKNKYDSVYLMLNEPTPIIKTGRFTYSPNRNHYLTDVVIEKGDGFHRIYGKKRTFTFHAHDDDWRKDIVKCGETQDYCIYKSDYYNYTPSKISRIFGAKPRKKLQEGWYMHKTQMKEVCFTVYGGLIEEHC